MARQVRRVEDYTTTALVMAFVNLIWVFFLIWSVWGFGAVLLTGVLLNHFITLLERRRHRR